MHMMTSHVDWIELIRAEYREVPGLHLTRPQVQRLWGLAPETCDRVLDELVRSNFLKRSTRNGYMRADHTR